MRAAAIQPRAVVPRAERRVRRDASLAGRRCGAADRSTDRAQAATRDVAPPPAAEAVAVEAVAAARRGPRWEIVRDEMGLARGGIRLAAMAAPIARNTGDNVGSVGARRPGGGERNCRLMGSSEPFDAARLAALYPTHDAYVARVKEATEKTSRRLHHQSGRRRHDPRRGEIEHGPWEERTLR